MKKIANFSIGPNHPPVLLAEIGTLFNQDVGMAGRLVDAVASANILAEERYGCSSPIVLKGELLLSADICLDDHSVERFQSRTGAIREERYRDLIARKLVPASVYRDLIAHASSKGLPVAMSVYDDAGIELARDTGVAALKIASSNVNHLPLIRHMALQDMSLILDTGRTRLSEVDRAVRLINSVWSERKYDGLLIIEHSPDGHPAPDRNHNLRSLSTLAAVYGGPVGLSCHAMDEDACIAAVALGAQLIEKNVCEDVGALEQDTAFALDIAGLPEFSARIRRCYDRLGDRWRDPTTQTGLIATSARMGLVARINVEAGALLNAQTCGFAFPCRGVSVEDFDRVQGWRFNKPLSAGDVVRWSDLNPE